MSSVDWERHLTIPERKDDAAQPDYPRHITLQESKRPQWYYKFQPYLGFVPLDDVFEGPIFARFKGTRTSFENDVKLTNTGEFIFDVDKANSWIRVEYALRRLSRAFRSVLVPLGSPMPPLPSDAKFHYPKKTVKHVIDSVVYAQKLVVFLIAELRHAIAVSGSTKDKNWVRATSGLDTVKDYDQSWLSDLAKSRAMTTTKLAGYLLKPGDLANPYIAHAIAYFGAPVYILYATIEHDEGWNPKVHITLDERGHQLYHLPFTLDEGRERVLDLWGQDPSPDIPYIPLPFNPSEDILRLPLITHSRNRPSSPTIPTFDFSETNPNFVQSPYVPTPSYPPHPNDDLESPQSPLIFMDDPFIDLNEQGLPQPFPDSGQSAGQWWYDHVREVRMARQFERDFGNDSDEEGEEVVESEKTALMLNKDDSLPLAFVSSVFVWEPTHGHDLFLLRRRLEREEARVLWPLFPPSHRVYNACADEWDLYDRSCDLVALKRKPSHENASSEPSNQDVNLEVRLFSESNPTAVEEPLTLYEDGLQVLRAHFSKIHGLRRTLFCTGNPQAYARRRFGFRFQEPPMVFHSDKSVSWWFNFGQIYQRSNPRPTWERQLADTVFCLLQGHTPHLHAVLDIYSDKQSLLSKGSLRIKRFKDAILQQTSQEKINLYLLKFLNEEEDGWVMGVPNASDIVLALREGWSDTRENMVQQFLLQGIRFYTLAAVPKLTTSQTIILNNLLTLPLVPDSGDFTPSDYFQYEKSREELLDSPNGRIVGRSGGIVARLWRQDPSKFSHRVKGVNYGPTDVALWKGIRVFCGEDEFYDDLLTETLDGLVCGMYLPKKSTPNVINSQTK